MQQFGFPHHDYVEFFVLQVDVALDLLLPGHGCLDVGFALAPAEKSPSAS